MRSFLSLTLATGFVGLLVAFPACGSSSNPSTDGGGGSAGSGGTKGSGGKDGGTDSGGFGADPGVKGPCFYATLGDGKTCVSTEHWFNLVNNRFPKDQCTVLPGEACGKPSANIVTHAFYFCCPSDCQPVGFDGVCLSQSAADKSVGMTCSTPGAPVVVGSPFNQCDGGGFSVAGAACCP